jgi:hypothetical protein
MIDWILENPDQIASADIVVGIPSHNEAGSIAGPVEQASLGLARYFPDKKAVIVNCDNASTDGTREAFFSAPCTVPRIYASTPAGVTGKGNNLRNLFRLVCQLKAEAAVTVDADIRSVSPQWIKNLADPLFNDFAFVTPIYQRHKYDGSINTNIVYPLTRCLYGRRVRQPVGGDFGFSGELAAFFLEHESWSEAASQYGIDIWMTTLAMVFRKPITQAFLGRPKIHRVKEPSADPGLAFQQVVGTIFQLQERFAPFWKEVRRSRPTAIFGFGLGDNEAPQPVEVRMDALLDHFVQGSREYATVWQDVLAPATYAKLQEVLALGEHMELPVQIWAQILFDFSLAHRDRIFPSETLLKALVPLYFGRTLTFVRCTEGMGVQQAEEFIEDQCQVFEESKSYLIDRWGS